MRIATATVSKEHVIRQVSHRVLRFVSCRTLSNIFLLGYVVGAEQAHQVEN